MTPDELAATKHYAQKLLKDAHTRFLTIPEIHVIDLAQEVDRLNAELTEARLSAEEAWENYDRVTETP